MFKSVVLFILIVMVFFFQINSVMAGDKPDKLIRFGVRGGFNSATTTEDFEGATKKSRSTFGAGIFMDYFFMSSLAAQINLLYNNKGVKFEGSDDFGGITSSYKYEEKLAYLSIPVLLRYGFPTGGSVMPYVMAGPELGILMSAKAKSESSYSGILTLQEGVQQDETSSDEQDIKDQLKSTELALNFGAGVEVPLSSIVLLLDVRYGLGLTKYHKKPETGEEPNAKNNVLYVNVGVALP